MTNSLRPGLLGYLSENPTILVRQRRRLPPTSFDLMAPHGRPAIAVTCIFANRASRWSNEQQGAAAAIADYFAVTMESRRVVLQSVERQHKPANRG